MAKLSLAKGFAIISPGSGALEWLAHIKIAAGLVVSVIPK
jgi:hypothetical protein